MIHDVDTTLEALVRRDARLGEDVDVVFDAPTKEWSSKRNVPTVDIYLYDVREDTRRRQAGQHELRADGRVVERRDAPRWFKLSYLVTAWTQRPVDEHRLLASLLRCFLLHDRLPPELLADSLAGVRGAVSYTCALPPSEDRALSDVWSALGGERKPSLDLVVVAPFELDRAGDLAMPVREGVRLGMSGAGARDQRVGRVPVIDAMSDPSAAASNVPGQGGTATAARVRRAGAGLGRKP